MIRLRKPKLDDRRIYAIIYRELISQARKTFPDLSVGRKALRKRLESGKTFVATKRKGMRPVGFITVLANEHDPQNQNAAFIDMLAIQKADQGHGWGSKLIDQAERYAKRKGCTSAYLYVDQLNQKGIQFYEHKGYSQVHYAGSIKSFLMSKPLTS